MFQRDVAGSTTSYFQINDMTFEIGGRKKGQKQIETASRGYIVKDDIETDFATVILP